MCTWHWYSDVVFSAAGMNGLMRRGWSNITSKACRNRKSWKCNTVNVISYVVHSLLVYLLSVCWMPCTIRRSDDSKGLLSLAKKKGKGTPKTSSAAAEPKASTAATKTEKETPSRSSTPSNERQAVKHKISECAISDLICSPHAYLYLLSTEGEHKIELLSTAVRIK